MKRQLLFKKNMLPPGKVRETFTATGIEQPEKQYLCAVTSDRISAFDKVLSRKIPGKGKMLNEIAAYFLQVTAEAVPNWFVSVPLPQTTLGVYAKPFEFELIVRQYLAGSMYKKYKKGQREFWGVTLPDGLREYEKLPQLMITPTTKAKVGHDLDITGEEIVTQKLATQEEYDYICKASVKVFNIGQDIARSRGLILVDTKYEFGKTEDDGILLIDEVNTPDSSRYIYLDGYENNLNAGTSQRELSKEPARRWLEERGFTGEPGQEMPELTDEFVDSVRVAYEELYKLILGKDFVEEKLPENAEDLFDEALNKLFEN